MPNPFDQFDAVAAPAANPFDQFDAVDPTPVRTPSGFGDYVHNIPARLAQLGGKATELAIAGGEALGFEYAEPTAAEIAEMDAVINRPGMTPGDVWTALSGNQKAFARAMQLPAERRPVVTTDTLDTVKGDLGSVVSRVPASAAITATQPVVGVPAALSQALAGVISGSEDPFADLERAGRVARFSGQTIAASAPDMAAATFPATLPAYMLARTEEIADERAANDQRADAGWGDRAVAAPAAAIESLLERFTTARLLPGGTPAGGPGALARVLQEGGIQAGGEVVEELAPYLAATAGTEIGATAQGAGDAALAAILAGGPMGGGAQGIKELAAVLGRGEAPAPAVAPVPPQAAAPAGAPVPAGPLPPMAPRPAPAADATLDELLLRNVLPPELEPAPVAAPPAAVATPAEAASPAPPQRAEAPYDTQQVQAEMRMRAQEQASRTAVPAAQVPAAPDNSRPVGGGDLAPVHEAAPAPQDLAPIDIPAAEAAAPVVAPQADDTPAPPQPIQYGKRRAAAQATANPEATARAQARVDRAFGDELDPSNPDIETKVELGRTFVESRRTRQAIESALAQPDDQVGHMLRTIASQEGVRPEQKWLADKLAPTLKALGVKLVEPPANLPYAGAYNNLRNELWIRQAAPTVVLHEALHGATSALLTYKTGQDVNPTLGRVRQEFDDMLKHLRAHIRDSGIDSAPVEIQDLLENKQGPLSNVKELLSYGMTEKPFQEYLATVPAPANRSGWRTMWDAFKSAIRAVLGGDKLSAEQRSFLDALIESTGELVDFAAENPGVARLAQTSEAGRIAREQYQRATAPSAVDAAALEEEGNDAAQLRFTPNQTDALTKAGLKPDKRNVFQRSADRVREEWQKVRDALSDTDALKQAAFDRFHGIRAAEARMGGLAPEESPYLAARLSTGLPSIMESLNLFGAPQWRDGVLSIDPSTDGLLDVLEPVKDDLDAWLGWMVGRRARLLKSQGREHLFTDADIDALLSLASGKEAAFKEAATGYLKIKNAILDVAEQAGLIDPVQRAAWDHAEYLPFYRQEGDRAVGPGTRRGLSGQASGIRTLKGGESALADPMANILRNFTKLIDASLKNRSMLLAVDKLDKALFEKQGPEFSSALIPMDQVRKQLLADGVPQSVIDAMPAGALKGVQKMFSLVPPTGDDVVRVMRNGKAEYYKVADPLLLRALTAFKEPSKSWAVKPFIFAKRLLTTGVTATAEFVGANLARDTASTWIIGNDRIRLGIDAANGAIRTLMRDKATRDMMAAGGSFIGGNFYGGDQDATAAALRRTLRARGLKDRDIEGFLGTIARSPLMLWDKWMEISSALENANRHAVFTAAIREGKPRAQAIFEAKDLMDFSMQGDSAFMQFFSDVLPFFNARVQGLYKLGRATADPQSRKRIAARGALLALASTALWYWNVTMYGDAYDELEEWDKDTYWHIAPGTEWHTRIPKPFEIGLIFGTGPERMAQAIVGSDRGEQTWNALLRAITGTLAINPIPQGALPIVEQWANRRFFTGRPIENMGDEKLLPEAREEWYSSDTMKLIADGVGNQTGLSAKRLEHLWNGYTGGLGGYVLDGSDWLVRQGTDAPERPDMAMSEVPVLGRFLRGDDPKSSRYVTEFYDLREQASQISGTIKEYLEDGQTARAERLERENAWLLGKRISSKRAKAGIMFENVREMEKLVRSLGEQRREGEEVAGSDAPGAEKRERLNAVTADRNTEVKKLVRRLREAERQRP